MKKVTVFVGSARKKLTHYTVGRFVDHLQLLGDIECEIVTLSDYRLETCRGCCVCFKRGEEFCPLKDDRDVLFDKIMASDGVVFATPNYSFHVSPSPRSSSTGSASFFIARSFSARLSQASLRKASMAARRS